MATKDLDSSEERKGDGMISFLEMVQQYPMGAKVSVPEEGGEGEKKQEVVGYEYYNGTGYLVFRNEKKLDVERLIGAGGTSDGGRFVG